MTLLVGAEKVVVAVPPSVTEIVDGLNVRALIVAVSHGSVITIVNTTFSASVDGVKVVEPAGPLLAIVIVFDNLTS